MKRVTMKLFLLAITSLILSNQAWAICSNQNLDIESSTASKLSNHSNGTVIDSQTGLMWQPCAVGLSGENCDQGSILYSNWSDALDLLHENILVNDSKNVGIKSFGYIDWRVPNINELVSIVENSCNTPAINESLFKNLTGFLWSSTPDVNNPDNVYVLNLGLGTIESMKKNSAYVEVANTLLVRDHDYHGYSANSLHWMNNLQRPRLMYANGSHVYISSLDPDSYDLTIHSINNDGSLNTKFGDNGAQSFTCTNFSTCTFSFARLLNNQTAILFNGQLETYWDGASGLGLGTRFPGINDPSGLSQANGLFDLSTGYTDDDAQIGVIFSNHLAKVYNTLGIKVNEKSVRFRGKLWPEFTSNPVDGYFTCASNHSIRVHGRLHPSGDTILSCYLSYWTPDPYYPAPPYESGYYYYLVDGSLNIKSECLELPYTNCVSEADLPNLLQSGDYQYGYDSGRGFFRTKVSSGEVDMVQFGP